MVHAAIRARVGRLLFRSWQEAKALWDLVNARVLHFGLVLMPDHLHALLRDDSQREPMARAMRGYAQWLNARRCRKGPLFEHGSEFKPISNSQHLERTRRYVHLNPCRKGLVNDPLAWPFSTHRDAVGLAIPCVMRPVGNAARFHAYVSGDPDVDVEGTPLPCRGPMDASHPIPLTDLRAAVSALTRTPEHMLLRRGPARSLLVDAALELSGLTARQIAAALNLEPATIRLRAREHGGVDASSVRLVVMVAGDGRFGLLTSSDLRPTRAWSPYRGLV